MLAAAIVAVTLNPLVRYIPGRRGLAAAILGLTLIAVVGALLLGLFAIVTTPREEEPQINVTMANVLIPFPGASSEDVQNKVA